MPVSEEKKSEYEALLRQQNEIIMKISELEMDLESRKEVRALLDRVPGDRVCMMTVGGALTTHTARSAAPALTDRIDTLKTLIEGLKGTLERTRTGVAEKAEELRASAG